MIMLIIYFPARSRSSDESFEMCSFEDDPGPLHGEIRSTAMKILLSKFSIRSIYQYLDHLNKS